MNPTSSAGSSCSADALYEASMARKTQDQIRIDGQSAIKLIQTASPPSLPDGATISVRA